jgi:Domain of unknown function (DUF4259)
VAAREHAFIESVLALLMDPGIDPRGRLLGSAMCARYTLSSSRKLAPAAIECRPATDANDHAILGPTRPMGAWGVGSFDNDDAADWLNDQLRRSADLRPIQTALDAVAQLDPTGYLEAPEASAAVAAAEVVAALAGDPAANLPSDVTA